MNQPIRVYRSNRNSLKKPYFKPRMIMKADGRAVITESKWYPDKRVCIRDWFLRGFIVIEDESIGGGFDTNYFPIVDLEKLNNALALKFKKKGNENDE